MLVDMRAVYTFNMSDHTKHMWVGVWRHRGRRGQFGGEDQGGHWHEDVTHQLKFSRTWFSIVVVASRLGFVSTNGRPRSPRLWRFKPAPWLNEDSWWPPSLCFSSPPLGSIGWRCGSGASTSSARWPSTSGRSGFSQWLIHTWYLSRAPRAYPYKFFWPV